MNRTFVETQEFTRSWRNLGLSDEDLRELQIILLANPDAGDVIQDTGGIRKIRISCSGHGKRGGARVLYIDVVQRETIVLLKVYAKNEKEDILDKEKKVLAALVKLYRRE